MPILVHVPPLGESITEAIVARWFKQPGDTVRAAEPIVELETDKVTVELPAPSAGVLRRRLVDTGMTVAVGDPVAEIDDAGAIASVVDSGATTNAVEAGANTDDRADDESTDDGEIPAAPTARAEARRRGLELEEVEGTGRKGRVLKEDVLRAVERRAGGPSGVIDSRVESGEVPTTPTRPREERPGETRVPMTTLRKRIAARLVQAQATAAILTTFNEVDMTAVVELRERYKQIFVDKHGVKLGFMSFFVQACVVALREFPALHAEIQGDEIVYKHAFDIGVAVGGGKGLVVPVVRDCDRLGFAAIEREIARLASLARDNRLQISDLTDGTFTISNGGIYGSMLSTPILNHPQSGILGLHNIVDRPVAVAGRVEIRPVMYLALSYDHRLVDGREAVQFLIRIKEAIEDPRRLMLGI